MLFVQLFEEFTPDHRSSETNHWIEKFKVSRDKSLTLKQLLDHKDQRYIDVLDYLLENSIIDASDMAKDGDNYIPALQYAMYAMNYNAMEILVSYGANLDHRIHIANDSIPYKEGSFPLQHHIILDMGLRMRYMGPIVSQYRRMLGQAIMDDNISANSVDSWGMNPIIFFCATFKLPPRSEIERRDVSDFIISIIRIYVDAGCDLASRDKFGRSAIWWLFERYGGRSELSTVIEFMLNHGGDIRGIDTTQAFKHGVNAIKYLDVMGCDETAVVLINAGFDLSGLDISSIVNPKIRAALENFSA